MNGVRDAHPGRRAVVIVCERRNRLVRRAMEDVCSVQPGPRRSDGWRVRSVRREAFASTRGCMSPVIGTDSPSSNSTGVLGVDRGVDVGVDRGFDVSLDRGLDRGAIAAFMGALPRVLIAPRSPRALAAELRNARCNDSCSHGRCGT